MQQRSVRHPSQSVSVIFSTDTGKGHKKGDEQGFSHRTAGCVFVYIYSVAHMDDSADQSIVTTHDKSGESYILRSLKGI